MQIQLITDNQMFGMPELLGPGSWKEQTYFTEWKCNYPYFIWHYFLVLRKYHYFCFHTQYNKRIFLKGQEHVVLRCHDQDFSEVPDLKRIDLGLWCFFLLLFFPFWPPVGWSRDSYSPGNDHPKEEDSRKFVRSFPLITVGNLFRIKSKHLISSLSFAIRLDPCLRPSFFCIFFNSLLLIVKCSFLSAVYCSVFSALFIHEWKYNLGCVSSKKQANRNHGLRE